MAYANCLETSFWMQWLKLTVTITIQTCHHYNKKQAQKHNFKMLNFKPWLADCPLFLYSITHQTTKPSTNLHKDFFCLF